MGKHRQTTALCMSLSSPSCPINLGTVVVIVVVAIVVAVVVVAAAVLVVVFFVSDKFGHRFGTGAERRRSLPRPPLLVVLVVALVVVAVAVVAVAVVVVVVVVVVVLVVVLVGGLCRGRRCLRSTCPS